MKAKVSSISNLVYILRVPSKPKEPAEVDDDPTEFCASTVFSIKTVPKLKYLLFEGSDGELLESREVVVVVATAFC